MRFLVPLLLAATTVVACDRAASDDQVGSDAARPEVFVDSALPIDTLLARFRATVADTPAELAGGASSPEALARALLTALQRQDTSSLRGLVMTQIGRAHV